MTGNSRINKSEVPTNLKKSSRNLDGAQDIKFERCQICKAIKKAESDKKVSNCNSNFFAKISRLTVSFLLATRKILPDYHSRLLMFHLKILLRTEHFLN